MKNHAFILFSITCCFLIGCKETPTKRPEVSAPQKKLLAAEWILGNWAHEDEDGILHEDWSRKNDTVFLGESYLIKNNDTLFFEYLRLSLIGDSLHYESLGEDIVNTKSKLFTGVYDSPNVILVENLLHSFPRTIHYTPLNDTLMMIEVSGEIDGLEETQPYQMIRMKSETK
jgi:hypothetical protein